MPEVQKIVDKLEELTSKPHSPEYLVMMDTYSKKWAEIAESACPWDWSYGLDALVEHLRWMRDYYKLGENVWATEDKEWKKGVKYTRLETLEKTLGYYDKWHDLEREYIEVVEHPETYKSHENDDGTVTIDDLGYHCIYKYGSAKRTYRKLHKAEDKYRKLFYKMLYKYLESWWD